MDACLCSPILKVIVVVSGQGEVLILEVWGEVGVVTAVTMFRVALVSFVVMVLFVRVFAFFGTFLVVCKWVMATVVFMLAAVLIGAGAGVVAKFEIIILVVIVVVVVEAGVLSAPVLVPRVVVLSPKPIVAMVVLCVAVVVVIVESRRAIVVTAVVFVR